MPWKEQVIETMREEFVKRVLAHEKSKAALCREYGIGFSSIVQHYFISRL